MKTPVTIYVVHHPKCKQAEVLAKKLYEWFRLGYLSGDSSAAGLPVHYRRQLLNSSLNPSIKLGEAQLNVVIVLVDQKMVADANWRTAIVNLSNEVTELNRDKTNESQAILLPGAMHESFYRTGPLYENFNPIRLLKMDDDRMEATIRRATTEATARMLLAGNHENPPPINVFLSHAKRDGTQIAERIRDEIRKFSQLTAWYDANDLPFGAAWRSPMEKHAKSETAAMVVTFTDAYPTRPWCRKEAMLARTPVQVVEDKRCNVWRVQPVVAVHQPKSSWVRGVPMLDGVPRIGWNDTVSEEQTERVVDRLVLEVLLTNVHAKLAIELEQLFKDGAPGESCFITWVPDAWTLTKLGSEMRRLRRRTSTVKRIIYPGYGLTLAEIAELEPVVTTFNSETKLISFEEAWK